MQTAVECLHDKWSNCKEWKWEEIEQWFEQAKEMERQQKGFSEEEVYKLLCSMPNFFKMTIPEQIEATDKWYREQLKQRQCTQ